MRRRYEYKVSDARKEVGKYVYVKTMRQYFASCVVLFSRCSYTVAGQVFLEYNVVERTSVELGCSANFVQRNDTCFYQRIFPLNGESPLHCPNCTAVL